MDLKLLEIFEAVLETRSVSHAASRLGTSQPGVSYGLNRLRSLTGDPLFVRVGNEMHPTPRALALVKPIRGILETIGNELLARETFVPETSGREFVFCMTDIGEMHYIPPIVRAAEKVAPNITFRVVSLPPEQLETALENGDVDLAVGYFPDLGKNNFFQQLLSRSSFVCIARAGHPETGRTLTLKRYRGARHVAVSTQMRSLEVLDRELAKLGLSDSIRTVLRVPHFMTLFHIVSTTDLLATVPLEVAMQYNAALSIRVHRLPFASPEFPLHQHWHRRYHHDPANQWVRRLVCSLFQKRPSQ
ncbi:LysR family transcriptional regulator [Burkholderia multivorans]|uniref:LysR family transcriptional regulator n=1 Tax=Burkholderia multivorans TaxID=87883 RepID=UPI001C26890C|nr:LysR family transcriptional regulator [Burkholderia multivorans]WVN01599.1 LysR family transcriptional regulator [Burkholderia multivorans]